MAKLQANNAKLRLELEELARQSEQADKELNELREDLAKSQHLIKEQEANHRKADDELLSLMRENEALKVELPSKSISDYKQSARYPDREVDIDPFTEKPEDNSVPMETRQEFDDSIPPEE
ncbi:hypothetical protein BHE74_00041747 [Ensete ventricosum]|nr:hypothetical protein GW17_00022414 [Ensete ventricosum]RWW51872.1 hypothetical protein BHE74_00041747 [Ensete ventricosum]